MRIRDDWCDGRECDSDAWDLYEEKYTSKWERILCRRCIREPINNQSPRVGSHRCYTRPDCQTTIMETRTTERTLSLTA